MATANWGGYDFAIYDPAATTWRDVPGVYVFAQPVPGGGWYAKYIGIADSFMTRLPNHERWAEAQRAGATHIHSLVVQQAATRATIEKALIGKYQPTLNTQHK
jgi:hypothetical protein